MFLVVTGKIFIDWRGRSCGHELRDDVVAKHRDIRKSACRERSDQPLLLIRPWDDLISTLIPGLTFSNWAMAFFQVG
jgi:hypothetical protein